MLIMKLGTVQFQWVGAVELRVTDAHCQCFCGGEKERAEDK